jgi:Mg-chelatase subunit ChlD
MHPDYTHISVILDRTGSMESIRHDVIGGFNTFLKDQQNQSGKATLTLVQFDSQDPYEIVHRFRPIAQVPKLTAKTYVPRASTPLYDAMGRGINDLDQCLSQLEEDDRPSKVMVVIITDGQENASQEFTREQVQAMIKAKTETDKWQFIFLSADLEAMKDAETIGIDRDSSLQFSKSGRGSKAVFESLSKQTSKYRSRKEPKFGFDAEDKEAVQDPDSPA